MCRKKPQEKSTTYSNKQFQSVAKFKYFGTTHNKLRLHSRRNQKQTKLKQCLLPSGVDLLSCFLFSNNIQNIQNHTFLRQDVPVAL